MTRTATDPMDGSARLFAGIYAADGWIFCQMQEEQRLLRETPAKWTLLEWIRQAENEPSIVFQARIDTLMDRRSRESDLRLTPVRLHSRECYRRLGVARMMEEMLMGGTP